MNLVIVDDEFLQRELVKKSIAWEKLNLSLIGEAEDGRGALRLIRDKRPDIVIMDINLPFKSGLEVSQIIKNELPETQIIILTAYGEFEYAREAIKLGAASFILKPVEETELENELVRASGKIQEIQMERVHIAKLKEEQFLDKKRQFVIEAVAGFRNRDEVISQCDFFRIPKDLPFFLMLLRVRETSGKNKEAFIEEQQEIIAEHFIKYEMLHMEEDYIFIVFANEKKDPVHVKVKSLVSFLNEEFCNKYGLYGGISNLHMDVSELHSAYKEAYWSANRSERLISFYEAENVIEIKKGAEKYSKSILDGLREKNRIRVQKAYKDYLESTQGKLFSNQSASYVMMELLIDVTSNIRTWGMNIPDDFFEMQEKIITMTTINDREQVCTDMYTYLETILDVMETRDIPSSSKKAIEAKKFIEEFYDYEQLSLNMVADKIGVNPSYLSNIFKKEWGETLSHCIIRVRLEKAQEIFNLKPWLTVEHVARLCGYSDTYYFSKSFKRFYGMSPVKFLERE